MTRFVVDASIAAKWFLPEAYSIEARSLLDRQHQLYGPELLPVEVCHVMVKSVRRGEIPLTQAQGAVTAIRNLVVLEGMTSVITRSFDVAMNYGASAYDAVYAVVAVERRCQLVTADRKLYRALSRPLPETLLWVADVPPPQRNV